MPLGEKTKELWKNPEYRKHMSEIHKGKKFSLQTKEKMSHIHQQLFVDHPEYKEKLIKTGKEHGNWKGDEVSYTTLHQWVRRNKPKPDSCEHCKQKEPKEVANVSSNYKRDINDYKWLCHTCHMKSDGRMNNFEKYKYQSGNNHPNWKGGISKDRKYLNKYMREWRHERNVKT